MSSCVMRKCTNYPAKHNKLHGITYHKFPVNKQLRDKWISVVRLQRAELDWMPTTASTICSVHFDPECKYESPKGRIMLKKTAVPIFHGIYNIYPTSTSTSFQHPPPGSDEEGENMAPILDSPRKVMKKRVRRRLISKKNQIQNKKISNMKNILQILRNRNFISEEQFMELNHKPEMIDLFHRTYDNNKTKKILRPSYPASFRKFAMSLNFYSPAAYKYVRRRFQTALPHPRCLVNWYENTTVSPGFTNQAFEILKNKSHQQEKRILCTLVADEIDLSHPIVWTGKKTDGLVDFGCGSNSTSIATHAYVLTLVCLNEPWKIPVGYFLVNNLTGETRAELLKMCLIKCYDSGVDVVALTFDGCTSNIAAANLLGCNLYDASNLKTTFKHPSSDKEVAVFLDPCHMIKLVRDTLQAKRVIFNRQDRLIKWQFLINLNKIQVNQELNDFANKLSERYINFRNEIMKIKLATQLFSRSVANVLLLCDKLVKSSEFTGSQATVEFINKFNTLFDIFNSSARDMFGFRKPICKQNYNEVMAFLEDAKNYILQLRIYKKAKQIVKDKIIPKMIKEPIVDSKCKTGFLGFIIGIESLKHLYSTLIENDILEYIALDHLRQDHIEIFFGSVRRHGGYDNKPNVVQFKRIYKKMISHIELRSGSNRNHISLEYFPIQNSSSAMVNLNRSSERQADEDLCDDDKQVSTSSDKNAKKNVEILAEGLNTEQCPDISKQIIGYISGWIARKLTGELKCETCIAELFSCKKMWFHKLISLKDIGSPCYSSKSLFMVCLKCEAVIKSYINENGVTVTGSECIDALRNRILKCFVGTKLFNSTSYSDHSRRQPPTLNHRLNLIRIIIEQYINVRMHFAHDTYPTMKKITTGQNINKLNLL